MYKVKLVKSLIGAAPNQVKTANSLRLSRIGAVVTVPKNPAIKGMLLTIAHLIEVQEVN